MNISYFLPSFARLRLYTYPKPTEHAVREDCFWTAMNFFNEQPDDGFFDPEYTQKILKTDYAQVPAGEKQFGDVLLLLASDRRALHMCVNIADDVVFTKNGFNTVQPWVLMKLSEMLASYEAERPFDVVIYRRRVAPRLSTAGFSSAPGISPRQPPRALEQ